MKGSPPLETQHPLALLGEFDEERADLALRQFMVLRALADIDALGFQRRTRFITCGSVSRS